MVFITSKKFWYRFVLSFSRKTQKPFNSEAFRFRKMTSPSRRQEV